MHAGFNSYTGQLAASVQDSAAAAATNGQWAEGDHLNFNLPVRNLSRSWTALTPVCIPSNPAFCQIGYRPLMKYGSFKTTHFVLLMQFLNNHLMIHLQASFSDLNRIPRLCGLGMAPSLKIINEDDQQLMENKQYQLNWVSLHGDKFNKSF